MYLLYLILILFCLAVLYYLRHGAIFVPTGRQAVAAMVRLAQIKPGMKVVDLGSGDGRIVIAFAQAGVEAVGLEVNPILVWWSRWKIRQAGLPNAKIITKSFWSVDMADFDVDVVVVFGMTHIMEKLQEKLWRELKPGSLIISNIFRFPNQTPIQEEGSLRVYRR